MGEIDMGEFSSFDKALKQIVANHSKVTLYKEPWWGDKETDSGNMSNRGFIIGSRIRNQAPNTGSTSISRKKLHINWTQEVPGSTLKECYRIFSIRPQDTMWDYYIGWTKSRHDQIPDDIKARLDKVGGVKKWNGRGWGS
jgi:hypothetical protein